MTTWTAEQCQIAITRRQEGKSAAVIGAELGYTRNAVLGRLHRMGLSQPRRVPTPEERERRRQKHNLQKWVRRGGQTRWGRREEEYEPRPFMVRGAGPRPVKVVASVAPLMMCPTVFADLGERQCLWPFGDPGHENFFYCGGDRRHKSSYCDHHHAVSRQ